METLPWYKSAIVRQQIVAFIVAALGLLKITSTIDIDATVAAVLAGVAALVPLYTIVTRIFKPAPNLSQTAAAKEVEMVKEGKIPPSPVARPMNQGGSIAVQLLIAMCAGMILVGTIAGCVSTQAAYKAAPLHGEAVSDTAYVIAEHYAAVLKEAANLRESAGVPAPLIVAMQKADAAAKPLIIGEPSGVGLRQLAEKYTALHDAKTEAELQAAVNNAVRALADLMRAVDAAKGK